MDKHFLTNFNDVTDNMTISSLNIWGSNHAGFFLKEKMLLHKGRKYFLKDISR